MSDYGNMPPPPPPPPGGFQAPQDVATGTLASWIQRVLAYLLDYVLILPFSVLQFVFQPKAVVTDVGGVPTTTLSGGNTLLATLMSLIGLAIWGYNRWYLGGQGQSFGKKTLGLTLVSEKSGQPIGMLMAFVRDLAHFIDGIICLIGYLFPLWDKKRQTIADKLLSTLVTAKA
jgi:uncharacterized RDD family membrane protein YckC